MNRAWYARPISEFLTESPDSILGHLVGRTDFDLPLAQRGAWVEQIGVLQRALQSYSGQVYLEFTIPRMGRRVDAIVIIGPILFVIEFKVGESQFLGRDVDQVVDYALDLHNFHEGSHHVFIAPILVCTEAVASARVTASHVPSDGLLSPSYTNAGGLRETITATLALIQADSISILDWEGSRYKPTPTIIEATLALYRGHSVTEISRSDADVTNLSHTSSSVAEIIEASKARSQKAICFVTGVPGAGKTLVGLDAATRHIDKKDELYSVFLSGNGPLVSILQEALARDRVDQKKRRGETARKGTALSEVKAFIQNVHHFRDDCLQNTRPPVEHVAIFDEAQRAWTLDQTANFMKRKKNTSDFRKSEPEFLISCLDRHVDWAVVICLVGGGQEINTGEAGISEWLDSLKRSFPHWKLYISDRLTDSEYGAGKVVDSLRGQHHVEFRKELHLETSIRSFRSEKVSRLVKEILDLETTNARQTLVDVGPRYPIQLTRNLDDARQWLREHARGSERYGIVVSSQAERLKAHGVDVRTPVNPVHWFLGGKEDVRSSYYLEDVATEFHVQGLELDWTCVIWDADFRHTPKGWEHWSFRGSRWERIRAAERQSYLKNAYRVLLTRARQGMVIVVPEGNSEDPTRRPEFYDPTFEYLVDSGFSRL